MIEVTFLRIKFIIESVDDHYETLLGIGFAEIKRSSGESMRCLLWETPSPSSRDWKEHGVFDFHLLLMAAEKTAVQVVCS